MTIALLQTAAEHLSTDAVETGSATLAWIDQLGLGLVGIFALLGLWRGLWWQVIRLLGVVLAIALARGLSPRFQPTVAGALDVSPPVSYGLVWMGIFLAGLVVATLFGLIGKRALEAMQLGLVDRAGGALAGALTGLVLHAALLVLLSAFGNPSWTSDALDGTRSAYLLTQLTRRPILLDAQAAETIVRPWAESWDDAPAEGASGDPHSEGPHESSR